MVFLADKVTAVSGLLDLKELLRLQIPENSLPQQVQALLGHTVRIDFLRFHLLIILLVTMKR